MQTCPSGCSPGVAPCLKSCVMVSQGICISPGSCRWLAACATFTTDVNFKHHRHFRVTCVCACIQGQMGGGWWGCICLRQLSLTCWQSCMHRSRLPSRLSVINSSTRYTRHAIRSDDYPHSFVVGRPAHACSAVGSLSALYCTSCCAPRVGTSVHKDVPSQRIE